MHGEKARSPLFQGSVARSPTHPCPAFLPPWPDPPCTPVLRSCPHGSLTSLDTAATHPGSCFSFLQLLSFHLFHHIKRPTFQDVMNIKIPSPHTWHGIGQVARMVENLPTYAGDLGSIPEWGRSREEGNGNPLQCSCQRIPWTEEPGRLQSMGHKEADLTE